MDVLSQIRTEVERELLECESTLLMRQLRLRIHELTFGQLKELLGSPAGRRLHARGVDELCPPTLGAASPKPRPVERGQLAQALKAVLQGSSRPLSPRELAEAVGAAPAQVQRALRLLRESGQILTAEPPPRSKRAGRGRGGSRPTTADDAATTSPSAPPSRRV